MPRAAASAIENNFKAGLITEASGLNFPESAAQAAENVVFDLRGRVYRRLGIDVETSAQYRSIDPTGAAITVHEWRNASGDGTKSFIVEQIGNTLYFYNGTLTTSPSAHYVTSIDLTQFKPAGAPDPAAAECQFANGVARLFVVHPTLEAFYVSYDITTDELTATQIDITIRDLEGLDSPYAVNYRPPVGAASLNHNHYYNLYNQGWPEQYILNWATQGNCPSMSDVWWTFKNADDEFDIASLANVARGNTRAPKGHFILNLFNQDRYAAVTAEFTPSADLSDIATTSTGYNRFGTNAFFTGRIFYSGLDSPGENSKVYFTQIIERDSQYGQCYQKNDPTAEDLAALEADDGGFVNIPEAGSIFKLFAMQSALIVFAIHGVFAITGSSGIGFSATDYVVTRLSDFRVTSGTTFVSVNGTPMWWTGEGIFTISGSSQGGLGLSVQVVSRTTIQTFFDSLPLSSKINARGCFNPSDFKIYWLYRSTPAETADDKYKFDSVLVLDMLTNAFYPWKFTTDNVNIRGIFTMDTPTSVNYGTALKFIISKGDGADTLFSLAELRDTNYIDFYSYDEVGSDFESYFITGYKVHGDAIRKFQPNWTAWYHEGVGQMYVQGVWDYNTSGTRFTPKQKLVFGDPSYTYSHRRVKIRGNGLALQFKVSSVSRQPFTAIGWVSYETGASEP